MYEFEQPNAREVPAERTRRSAGKAALSPVSERDLGRDLMGQYLQDIAGEPLLTAEQEVDLAKAIEAGLMAEHLLAEGRVDENAPGGATEQELQWLADEGRRAIDRFVTSNLPLVIWAARKFGDNHQLPMIDVIQEGNVGLLHAVEKFDYTKGNKFSTYATWWIRQTIDRGAARTSRLVRVPFGVSGQINQMARTRDALERQLGRAPEVSEIAEELGLEIDQAADLIRWDKQHTSLDLPIGDKEGTPLGDLLAQETVSAPDDEVLARDARERLKMLITSRLDERSADIVRLRYGLVDGVEHNYEAIGDRYDLSREGVRKIIAKALNRLRSSADRDLLP